jgi:hypothetical protein
MKTIKRWLMRMLGMNRKLEWSELTETQRQMLLAIKAKQQRFKRLKVVK